MSGDLFSDLPFNLAGESVSSELTAEAEARVRALAESEARKAQLLLMPQAEIREAAGKFHIYTLKGYYHCTCVTRAEAERVMAERFPV